MAAPSPEQAERKYAGADRLLFAVLAAAAGVGCVLFFGYEYGRDQGIYATVAGVIARGGAPYLDAWDFKPPGIFAVYTAGRALFGTGMSGVRLLELVSYASLVPAFMCLSRRWLGDAKPGMLAAFIAFYAQFQLEYWDTGQPESFAGVAVAWALVFASRAEATEAANERLRACAASGLLYAVAGLFKPHLGAGLAVSAWLVAAAVRRRGGSGWAEFFACSAGAAFGLALCATWLLASGAGAATFETFAVFLPAYHALSFEWSNLPAYVARSLYMLSLGYTALLPAGLVALAVLPKLGSRERHALVHVGAVLAIQLAGVAYQGRFYPYHFGASLTLLALPAGWGLWKIWRVARHSSLGVAASLVGLVLLALPAPAIPTYGAAEFWQRVGLRAQLVLGSVDPRALNLLHTAGDVHYGANRRVAEWLATHTDPAAPIYIWGFESMIYEMAGRRPASRWIYNVPQRLDWAQRERARSDLMRDLAAEPPAAIVLVRNDVRADVTGSRSDSQQELESFAELRDLLSEGYRRAFHIEDFEVHLPRD